jgi:DNA invertase Pin-like site-specific DNA recombinase
MTHEAPSMIRASICAPGPGDTPARDPAPRILAQPDPEPQAPSLAIFGPPPYAYGYVWVARLDEQNSAEVQREKIEERVKRGLNGHTWTQCLGPDDASGDEVPFGDRPIGRFLLRVLQKGDAIIIAAMDRLGRSVRDIILALSQLHNRKVEVYVVDRQGMPIDIVTPVGKSLVPLMMDFMEFENGSRRKRIRDAMGFRKKYGLRYTHMIPLGQRCEEMKGPDGNKQTAWVRDEEQCKIIREIYTRRHDKGHSFARIAADLVRRGVKDQNGYQWSWWAPSARKWVVRKIRRAYRYAAQVLEETGAFP